MRWLSFLILAYFITGIQLGLGGYITWGQAAPNLILPVVVFIAINAQREQALLAVLALGWMQDLLSQQPPGLYGFSYGMIGLFLVGARHSLYQDHPLAHFVLTLAAGLGTGLIILFNEWAYPLLHQSGPSSPSISLMFMRALYSALLAPLILFPLVRMKKIFGFKAARGHPHLSRA